jgi:hypothetical protein
MQVSKLFFDFEFTGLHQKTTPISLGIVSDCGKKFYAEFNDYDQRQIEDWLKENVISNLKFSQPKEGEDEYYVASRAEDNPVGNSLYHSYNVEMRGDKRMIVSELNRWLKQFELVELWSDCLHYDFVLFCEMFGGAMKLPNNIYYIPFDLCTLLKVKGIDPDVNREVFGADAFSENGEPLFFDAKCNILEPVKHNALWDAEIIKRCYDKLMIKPVIDSGIVELEENAPRGC